MDIMDTIGIKGHVYLRAYTRGVIPMLVNLGHDYDDAKRIAADWIVDTVESDNIIVTSGKELVASMLMDRTGYDTGLTYCAIGTDNTAPAVGDTTLTTEAARLTITSKARTVNAVTYSTFFTSAQSGYAIEEVGLFGHSTASASADSGEMMNHALVSYDNSAGSYDLTIDVVITFG